MPDPTQRPNMPSMSTPGEYTCKCPNCGQDMKLTLSKSGPTMAPKRGGLPVMHEPESEGSDMAGMLDKASGGGY